MCCSESYLVEWVRDDVLNRSFEELERYFPDNDRDGIRERWKRVVKALHAHGRIPACQDFGGATWKEFFRLVEFRNGLVHGGASRPAEASQRPGLLPSPTPVELDSLQGWAIGVVYDLITDLHHTVGTKPPKWLKQV